MAAERESLLDEVRRMIDAAQGVTECVNEMLVNKKSPAGDGEAAQGTGDGTTGSNCKGCAWLSCLGSGAPVMCLTPVHCLLSGAQPVTPVPCRTCCLSPAVSQTALAHACLHLTPHTHTHPTFPAGEDAGLIKELLADVRQQRGLFEAILAQLGELKGPDVEALTKQALEAVDMLDGALALERVRRGGGKGGSRDGGGQMGAY